MIARHRQSRRRSSSLRAHAIALSRSYMRLCLRRHVMDTRRARTHVHVYVVLSAILSVAYSARFVMHRHFVFPRENFACQSTNGKVNRIHDATRGRLPPAGREHVPRKGGIVRLESSYRIARARTTRGGKRTWRDARGLRELRSAVYPKCDHRYLSVMTRASIYSSVNHYCDRSMCESAKLHRISHSIRGTAGGGERGRKF